MRLTKSQLIIAPFLLILDIAVIWVSLYTAYHLRFYSFVTDVFPITKGLPLWLFYKNSLYFIIPVFVFVFFQNGLYRTYFIPLIDELIRIIRSVSLGLFFLILTTFFYRDVSFSRLTFALFWLISILLLFTSREMFKLFASFVLRSFSGRESVLVVGRENKTIRALIKKHPHLQVYYFPYEEESDIAKLRELILDKTVSQVLIIRYNWGQGKLLEFYDWCENAGVELKFVPDLVQLCKGEVSIDSSLGIPFFHLRTVSLSGFNFYFKRVLDIIAAILILSVLWPFLFLVALLIMIDSKGHFLYHHKRMGYRGKNFNFYKFRTMVRDADVLLEKIMDKSERKGPVFKMSNDPRITSLGRVLRRFSIDEIPQLLNVLRGDMSLVGPRPQVLWEASAYDDWAKRRLRVLPGITGLWQVSGRASLSYEEMIKLDIFYIENWSLGLDINILLNTLPAIFSKKGAY